MWFYTHEKTLGGDTRNQYYWLCPGTQMATVFSQCFWTLWILNHVNIIKYLKCLIKSKIGKKKKLKKLTYSSTLALSTILIQIFLGEGHWNVIGPGLGWRDTVPHFLKWDCYFYNEIFEKVSIKQKDMNSCKFCYIHKTLRLCFNVWIPLPFILFTPTWISHLTDFRVNLIGWGQGLPKCNGRGCIHWGWPHASRSQCLKDTRENDSHDDWGGERVIFMFFLWDF